MRKCDKKVKKGQGKRRQGKRRQNNRGTGTGNRGWRQVKRDRINGDRITEEQR